MEELLRDMRVRAFRLAMRNQIRDVYVRFNPTVQHLSTSSYAPSEGDLDTVRGAVQFINAMSDDDMISTHGQVYSKVFRTFAKYGAILLARMDEIEALAKQLIAEGLAMLPDTGPVTHAPAQADVQAEFDERFATAA